MNALQFSSGSRTVVLTPSSEPGVSQPDRLVFPVTEKKVDQLVQEMLGYELFSSRERNAIIAWRKEASLYLSHQVGDKTAIAIASFLLDFIRPALCEGKDKCLDFEDALMQILEPLLPFGQSVDAFLDQVEEEDLQRAAMEEKLRRLDQLHREEIRRVCDEGNRETKKILHTFGELKKTLSGVNQERREMVREAHQEFDRLTKEAESSSHELALLASRAEQLGEELVCENADLLRLLEEGRNLKV